jgi:hypothetical protein
MPKKAKSAKTPRAKRDRLDPKLVIRKVESVLKANGITAKIDKMTFSNARGSSCTCPDGRTGVLRVVGGKLICVCPN